MRTRPGQHLGFSLVIPCKENPVTLAELRANKRVLFEAATFAVICLAEIENRDPISRWRSGNVTLKDRMWNEIYLSLENIICHRLSESLGEGLCKGKLRTLSKHGSSGKPKILGFMEMEAVWCLWVQDGSSKMPECESL